MHNISYKTALGGIISSLCLLCMFMTGVLPVLYITLPMAAGILMMIMSIEVDSKWAFLTFLSTSILSLFISFDKEAALLYILLFGHYPIIKKYLDKISPSIIRIIVKIILFNICIATETVLTIKLLGSDEFFREMIKKGMIWIIIYFVGINFVCLSYDYCLKGLVIAYNKRLKPKLKRNK